MATMKTANYAKMYFATYPDGTLSADSYNIARAKNHTAVLAETIGRNNRRQIASQSPVVSHSSSAVL